MNNPYRVDLIDSQAQAFRANRCFVNALLLLHVPLQEQVGLDPKRVNFSEGKMPSGRIVGLHRHPFFQLELVLSGSFLFHTSAFTYLIKPGDAVFILPELEHGWRCQDEGVLMGLEFEGVEQVKSGKWIEGFTLSKRRLLRSSDPAPELLNACLEELTQHDSLRESRIAGLMQAWLCKILLQSKRIILKSRSDPVKTLTERSFVESAVSFIHTNYEKDIDVTQIAHHTGTSTRQLHRLFNLHHQTTPQRCIEKIRMQKARELLRYSPGRQVKDVANLVGFSSHNYFINRYKRHYGHSPGKEAGS